jgi:hypothetical protein
MQKKRDNHLRNWQDAKTRNCTPQRIYEDIDEASADNMLEVFDKVSKLGYAVVRDYRKLINKPTNNPEVDAKNEYSMFAPENEPTPEQAAYWNTQTTGGKTKPPMETIFEGVTVNQGTVNFLPSKPTVPRPGTQLRSVMQYGTKAYKTYQELYKGQADDIIKGIFAKHKKRNGTNPAADPTNWVTQQNVVVGAQDHQHPHCDQGKVGSFASEDIFPFVAVHGFGMHEFQLWLLPCKKKRDYGFLYLFPKTAIVFMRGDFVHAGGCGQDARGHIEFFPQAQAGWDDDNPYWERSRIAN